MEYGCYEDDEYIYFGIKTGGWVGNTTVVLLSTPCNAIRYAFGRINFPTEEPQGWTKTNTTYYFSAFKSDLDAAINRIAALEQKVGISADTGMEVPE